MCGLVGFLYKSGFGPVGEVQVKMLDALYRRGPDSTGIAIYGRPNESEYVLHARLRDAGDGYREGVVAAVKRLGGVKQVTAEGSELRARVVWPGDLGELADSVEHANGEVEVMSVGRAMEIIKDVGSASELDRRHRISSLQASHAIGHTRMATESRVDVLHSHPFWARPFADIAVVHNGHITNEHKLKRRLAMKGHRFYTGNDSEAIAVYIADKLEEGVTLDDALRDSVQELDGTFAYLVSTDEGIGVARDPFATKPMLWAETDEFVVLASEEVAIRAAFPDVSLVPQELAAGEVRWWLR
jgi:methylamine---glutamate N-methyltransferase subunit A